MIDATEFFSRNAEVHDVAARFPAVVFGVGAVGSFVAYFLALSGFPLVLVDRDDLQVANLARHVLDATDLRKRKAIALARRLRKLVPKGQPIRGVAVDANHLTDEELETVVDGAGLVVATNASDRLDHRLTAIARRHRLLMVVVSMWPSLRGDGVLGDVLVQRFTHDVRGCFDCLHPTAADLVDSSPEVELSAQVGLASDVAHVATIVVELIISLVSGSRERRSYRESVEQSRHYFLVQRGLHRVRAIRPEPRPGCPTCSLTTLGGPRPTPPDANRAWAQAVLVCAAFGAIAVVTAAWGVVGFVLVIAAAGLLAATARWWWPTWIALGRT